MVPRPALPACSRETRANLYHSVSSNHPLSMWFTLSMELARGKYRSYISAASTRGRTSSKYERFGTTAIPPLTSEPPPTPRPTYTDIWSKCTLSSTPAYGSMSRLITSSHRNEPSGASVRDLNQLERRSGESIPQKTLPSSAGLFHSWPISSMSVGIPASPSRSAETAAPYPVPITTAGTNEPLRACGLRRSAAAA